ncbi:ECF transporter S component [Mycoplasma leonicaptivi]|uniref:ECF transporter S component n=1 Tax=Mycoplasma leonicaptivi TaxID=36742 RepID=UPI00048953A3|nr:ECF transporter S component [Mycoplasma leonicaptivi]
MNIKMDKLKKILMIDNLFLPKWTIKKMVYVGILIAISVAFVIVIAEIMPWTVIPSYKIAFIGLPIKIAGFIFGPAIGLFVGVISDILSILFIPPAGYNPLYTVATAMNGFIAGIFGFYFLNIINKAFSAEYKIQKIQQKIALKSLKYNHFKEIGNQYKADKIALVIIKLNTRKKYIEDKKEEKLLVNINLLTGILCLVLVISLITLLLIKTPDSNLENSIIKNRIALMVLMSIGTCSMIVFILFSRFLMKPKNYIILVPIIVFSAFLELINVPLLSLADLYSIGSFNIKDIFIWITQHILASPIKIWVNTFVIFFSYSIISKLINKTEKISYK